MEELWRKLAAKTEEYFNNDNWTYDYEEKEDAGIFRSGYGMKNKVRSVALTIICEENGIVTHTGIPISAGEDVRQETMKFLTLLNYGLRSGCMQMDLRDGAVNFRSYLPCVDVPGMEMIHHEISLGHFMWQKYGDALMSVLFGMKSAEEAMEDARRED
ncbi:MAG: hypothetical protein IJP92_00120 [Lachnospiraceae bacterium]|nr:hypothetical protein [Lachnospiraceae bacterium]